MNANVSQSLSSRLGAIERSAGNIGPALFLLSRDRHELDGALRGFGRPSTLKAKSSATEMDKIF